MFGDWSYLLYMIPAMIFAGWAQAKVKAAYAATRKIPVPQRDVRCRSCRSNPA